MGGATMTSKDALKACARELLAQGYHDATMYGSEEAAREPDFQPTLEEEAALWAIEKALTRSSGCEDARALREALESIAEGNLGDQPWQANYDRIRTVACDALAKALPSLPGEGM